MNTEIIIQRVGLEGQGVGYDSTGNIYFVPDALPGDHVRVRYADTGKKYRDAELEEVLVPSPDRREPACRYFKQCGGCDWQNWEYGAQLKAKEGMVGHVLERAQWEPKRRLSILGATQVLGYRNRVQLRAEGGKVGFLRRRSHEIVDVVECLVAHPAVNEVIAKLHEEFGTGEHRTKVELALSPDGSVSRAVNSAHAAKGFSQVNNEQNERLRQTVASLIKEGQSRQVVELFCGNGNLTHAYSKNVEKIFAMELSREALETARNARDEADQDKVLFIEADVGPDILKLLPREFRTSFDTLVLDPPRSGVGRSLENWVAPPSVRNVIYVSCSPQTFGHDVSPLKGKFQLETVQAIDMFPQTRHIEFVAWFRR